MTLATEQSDKEHYNNNKLRVPISPSQTILIRMVECVSMFGNNHTVLQPRGITAKKDFM